MPRTVRPISDTQPRPAPALLDDLVAELKGERRSGQPLIAEDHFPAESIRVMVFWDRWEPIDENRRAATILDAYRTVEGEDFSKRIGLVYGMTFPEGHNAGKLPIQIIAALRPTDPVTREDCHRAMIAEGASLLFEPTQPHLRLATTEQAAECVKRLIDRLPGSDPIWLILRDVGPNADLDWDDLDS